MEDAGQIARLEHLSFEHPAERFTERKVRYLIKRGRAVVLVAEADGRVLGWVAGFRGGQSAHPWGRVYALAVHPEARGRRLGPRLLQNCVAELAERGARRIFLEARSDNSAAIALYRKLGFQPCRELRDYYAPGLHAQRMVKRLGPTIA